MNHAFLTVDLGFGDAGKGSIVDFLTRHYEAHTVVRYNGGAQAGHRVVTENAEHVFSQFGSGTLAGANTHLSRFMLLEPLAMLEEEKHLRSVGIADAFQRTTIDEGALVVTPFQRAANRLRELARGDQRHGSCGMGIGEAMADRLAYGEQVLFAQDLTNIDTLYRKLSLLRVVNLSKIQALQGDLPNNAQVANELALLTDTDWCEWLLESYRDFTDQAQIVAGTHLADILQQPGAVIFEGAQGVLLDEWRGFHPYTTWSTTTLANADRLLTEAGYRGDVTRIGITRAYATRHGAGPFVSEDAALTETLRDPRNGFGEWQRGFRVGWLDLVMLRYAIESVGRVDELAITCLDRLAEVGEVKLCTHYNCEGEVLGRIAPAPLLGDLDYQTAITARLGRCQAILQKLDNCADLLRFVGDELGVPIRLLSEGVTAQEKRWLTNLEQRSIRSAARQ